MFDNVILDAKGYWEVHPGGRFFLEKNYGRDISKFYFGGYSMVQGKKPYTHSAWSLSIIKSMVVGVIDG